MEKQNRPISILNLAGELVPELAQYFSSKRIVVVNPLLSNDIRDFSHILTKDVHDFTQINKTYEVTKNHRHMISLSQVHDLQNFTINNGNMVLGDYWFKGAIGTFILDRYFQSYGIPLGENYPSFNEIGSFNIANPFNTGEYLDRLVQKAFENGSEALAIKTYFDHLIMFVSGLKNKGKAGLPVEVTYGVFQDIFAVQVHFYSKQINVMDVSASLSSTLSKKAEEYYLNVAVQSADFFDFSYMPLVNKAVVTSLWTKDERITYENRGLMLSLLLGGLPLANYQNEGTNSSLVLSPGEFVDFSSRVTIPEKLSEEVESVLTKGIIEEGEHSVIVKGEENVPSEALVIKGSIEKKEEALLIKDPGLLEELVQTIKGKVEEDKTVNRIPGTNKIDTDKFVHKIAASVDETTKEKNLKIHSIGSQIPQSLKTGLFDFAKSLNKSAEDLSDSEIAMFQLEKVPDILKAGLLASSIDHKEEARIVESGSTVKEVEIKLATADVENEKLRSQVKTLTSEVRILKETRKIMAEIQMKAEKSASQMTMKSDDDDDDGILCKEFQLKISEKKLFNENDLKKLFLLLERESRLISDLREEKMKNKKLELEASQKEITFFQEVEKLKRVVKGKDLILIKTKETFTKLVEKKDKDFQNLNQKFELLSRSASDSPDTFSTQIQRINVLEKQNLNLLKQVEMYKSKLVSMATNMQSSKSDEDSKDEARKLQMLNQLLKNQLDISKKENEKFLSKAELDSAQISQLRTEKNKVEDQLKKVQTELKVAISNHTPRAQFSEQELKRPQPQTQVQVPDNQARLQSMKITDLETKLAEALRPGKAAVVEDSSKKVFYLENSVKKLTQDILTNQAQLAEAKKETQKLRQEKNALHNQVEKLKKDMEKLRSATPKKPGGKAA